MGKRGAVAAAARPAKAAKTKPAEVEAVDPLLEACAPIAAALRGALGGSAAEALCAGLPHALHGPPAGRHDFQERLLDAVQAALAQEEARRGSAVAEAEESEKGAEQDRAACSAELEEANARAAEKAAARDLKGGAVEAAEQLLEAAKAGVAGAQAALSSHLERCGAAEKEKAEHEEGLRELWLPLKASELEGKGWRERNKMIAKLSAMLQQCNAPESMLAALPLTLKEKPEKRGAFGLKTIEAAEEMYQGKLQELAAQIEGLHGETQAKQQTIDEAQAASAAARAAYDAAVDESIAFQNAWADETTVVQALKEKLRALQSADPAAELAAARRSLGDIQEMVALFASLRSGGGPPSGDAPASASTAAEGA